MKGNQIKMREREGERKLQRDNETEDGNSKLNQFPC